MDRHSEASTAVEEKPGAATPIPSGAPRRRLWPRAGDGEPGSHMPWILAVCCVAQFMVILDLSIVNVALPSIQSALSFTSADLQWVIDAYAITFAGFLMLGGRAADQFGQRRTFVVALLVFGAASLIGGAAQDRLMLTAARAAQGFGGALMAASSLAIITSSFPAGPQRHRAIGMWAAMNGLGGAAGVLFGGIITEALSWRWVLLINPPIAIGTAMIAYAVVSERRGAGRRGFDLGGALTLTIGQMVLVYGVVQASTFSWGSAEALVPIAAGLLLLAAFGVIEARFARAPLVPFKEITRPLGVANTIVLLFSAAIFPMWFVSSLYLQQVLGLSPLHAGLVFLPMALTIMICARRAGALVGRFGVRSVLGSGLLMMTVGLLLLARIQSSGSPVVYVVIPGILTAAGIGLSIVPSTIAATQGAKEGQAGLASGLVNTSRQVGGGLGLAFLITLATQLTTHLIGHGHEVPSALTDGFRLAFFICAGLCAAAAVMTFTMVSEPARAGTRRIALALGVVGGLALIAALDVAFANSRGAPIGAYTLRDTYTFASAPSLHPPKIKLRSSSAGAKLAPGYIFLTNFYDVTVPPMVGQSGPLILDRGLHPVWFKPVPKSVVAGNLAVQSYKGQPVLAWWQGVITNTGETESGEDVFADRSYRTFARLKGADGWIPTLHEILIQGDHVWITANKSIPHDLSRYGGAYNGDLTDSAVQEYDLKTGKLLYSWDALRHIPLADARATLPTNGFPWDAYHVNSVELVPGGRFLVSMRNTWAVYLVDVKSGRILWTLGGRHSDFKLNSDTHFEWQHNVVLYSNSTLTMFDDHCCQITGGGTYVSPTGLSRGLVLLLDQKAHHASLVAQYTRPDNSDAEYMGNTQPLQGGNVFVGWGSLPAFSEFSRSGQLLMDARMPHPDLSYRATLEPWVGAPLYPPSGAARSTGGKVTVYASWNGATEVASWRILGGRNAGAMRPVATAGKAGFETRVTVPTNAGSVFTVQALDRRGRLLGTSKAFSLSKG